MVYESVKWSHYPALYANHLVLPGSILEIGIREGGSLRMWKQLGFNPVFGIDRNYVQIPGCHCIQAEVGDPHVWHYVRSQIGGPLDNVIDDGSHRPWDQLAAFKELWPMLAPNGVYCIEDLHMQQKLRWRFLSRFVQTPLTLLEEIWKKQHGPYKGDKPVRRPYEVHVYPHIMFIKKNKYDCYITTENYS